MMLHSIENIGTEYKDKCSKRDLNSHTKSEFFHKIMDDIKGYDIIDAYENKYKNNIINDTLNNFLLLTFVFHSVHIGRKDRRNPVGAKVEGCCSSISDFLIIRLGTNGNITVERSAPRFRKARHIF